MGETTKAHSAIAQPVIQANSDVIGERPTTPCCHGNAVNRHAVYLTLFNIIAGYILPRSLFPQNLTILNDILGYKCRSHFLRLNTITGETMTTCHHTDSSSAGVNIEKYKVKAISMMTYGHFFSSYSIEPIYITRGS